jgi:hypothetical protein
MNRERIMLVWTAGSHERRLADDSTVSLLPPS